MKRKNDSYFGFSGSSEFLSMGWEEFCAYLMGEVILSIGSGKFQERFGFAVRQACAWGIYNDKGSR